MNRYPNLPCLDLGGQNKTPMELCHTVATNRSKLSPKEQADFVRATAKPAYERRQNILDMLNASNMGTDPILRNFGIERVSNVMTTVPAHVLDAPAIEYGGQKVQQVRQGKWDNMNKTFIDTKVAPNSNFKWIFINCTSIEDRCIDELIGALIDVSHSHNLNIGEPHTVKNIYLDKTKPLDFRGYFVNKPYSLIVIALPTAPEYYSKIFCSKC